MLYLEDRNWPNEPTNYSLVSIDLANQETTTIHLEMPHPQNPLIGSAANAFTHHYTSAGLYVLFGGLAVFHLRHKPAGAYFPAIISVLLTAAAYLMSILFNWTYQTITIALGPLIIELAVCSILFCLFAFYLQRHRY
ncbi:hypothetical protein D7Z54_12360 [Salibacterium salarium]|uniref:Uncharacterized protein n=1 Tax=Salibacterium salarium TaxID=284579 RepID=A0A3R9QTI2_9BACI|nr:hypothetical protein [Salibacterium salarium]RSL33093.1 hypothetical protein D7Z54_12360 [Salibacterium salarium]